MASKSAETYSPRMQLLLDGIARVRKENGGMDRAISFFEHLSMSEEIQIFYFGGFLRDAYLGFAPRDLDIVVNSGWERFENATRDYIMRKNRFGGLKMKLGETDVDAWSVNSTDTFARKVIYPDSINHLPETTVLNAESIVLEIWAPEGNLWGFERGFFDGCDRKILEIANPWNADFQESMAALQLGRIYRLNKKLNWRLGGRLRSYVERHVKNADLEEIKSFYESHYGEKCEPENIIKYLSSLIENE